jgi:predicted transcriptional regulator
MEIHLTPEQEAALSGLAASRGEKSEELAQRILSGVLEDEIRTAEAVKRAREQLKRGEYLTHEEMGQRIESWFARSAAAK